MAVYHEMSGKCVSLTHDKEKLALKLNSYESRLRKKQ